MRTLGPQFTPLPVSRLSSEYRSDAYGIKWFDLQYFYAEILNMS